MSLNGSYSLAAALSFTSISSPGGVLRNTRCQGDATHTVASFLVHAGIINSKVIVNIIRLLIALLLAQDASPCKDSGRVVLIFFSIISIICSINLTINYPELY